MSYTPGPWELSGCSDGEMHELWNPDETTVIGNILILDGMERAECDANARLIAAATELVEALKKMLHAYAPTEGRQLNASEKAREALRKAGVEL